MMTFSDHPDHNRNIQVTFDNSDRCPHESTKYIRSLPKQVVFYVGYIEKDRDASGKAIRLDNEVMHVLKAAPTMLHGLRMALNDLDAIASIAGDVPEWNEGGEFYETCHYLRLLISEASKTTY